MRASASLVAAVIGLTTPTGSRDAVLTVVSGTDHYVWPAFTSSCVRGSPKPVDFWTSTKPDGESSLSGRLRLGAVEVTWTGSLATAGGSGTWHASSLPKRCRSHAGVAHGTFTYVSVPLKGGGEKLRFTFENFS
jgi:hypothetical protein